MKAGIKHFSSVAKIGIFALTLLSVACSKKDSGFSLLAESNTFKQTSSEVNGKIDILFMIDNSGSMATSQQALADNFRRFIERFDAKGFDYRLAVATSDAYRVLFGAAANKAKFKDGTAQTSFTGVFVIDPSTPNLVDTFTTNVKQGTFGSGDERAFSSLEQALQSPENASFGFPRPDAFLAIIILSDEDDFSWDGSASIDNQYSHTGLHSVDRYVSFLDQKMGANSTNRSSKYNVNAISILDSTCLAQLNVDANARKIGQRYIELANKTGGLKRSLCDDFGTTMSEISHKIIELRTRFPINGEPNVDTLHVFVDGVEVPRTFESAPQPWVGYIYHADDNSVSFHGDAYVPGPGSAISVSFDPTGLR